MNHVEASIATALAYIGITDMHTIAVEYDEFADDRLQQSIRVAESRVDKLVESLAAGRAGKNAAA